tara:strand:+ start:304 stop:483 length:180 start_codon:yes stop_codon:yes gene_type:complete
MGKIMDMGLLFFLMEKYGMESSKKISLGIQFIMIKHETSLGNMLKVNGIVRNQTDEKKY